jgi:HSP20 family protein
MADEIAKKEEKVPVRRPQAASPYRAMREMMNSMMDDYFPEWPGMRIRPFEWRMQEFSPNIDVIEEEDRIRVEAEVPGMSPEDLELTVTGDSLCLKGEKRSEREEERQGVRYSERSFGSFQRYIPIGTDVETDRIEARFKNGLLQIVIPKSEESLKQSKKIEIKAEGQEQQPRDQTEQDIRSMGSEEGMKQQPQERGKEGSTKG